MVEYFCAKPEELTQFSLGSESCVPRLAPSTQVDGVLYVPSNWLIYCPECGDPWAKRVTLTEAKRHWQTRARLCMQCGFGGLWDAWDEPWNRSLPAALLNREMLVIQAYRDAGIKTYNDYFEKVVWRKNHAN